MYSCISRIWRGDGGEGERILSLPMAEYEAVDDDEGCHVYRLPEGNVRRPLGHDEQGPSHPEQLREMNRKMADFWGRQKNR